MGGVTISPNIKRTSVRIDPAGNEINPRTKQITRPIEAEYVPPVAPVEVPQAPTPIVSEPSGSISVIEQIRQAKENLAQLEELKKLKIAEKEAELELLKQ